MGNEHSSGLGFNNLAAHHLGVNKPQRKPRGRGGGGPMGAMSRQFGFRPGPTDAPTGAPTRKRGPRISDNKGGGRRGRMSDSKMFGYTGGGGPNTAPERPNRKIASAKSSPYDFMAGNRKKGGQRKQRTSIPESEYKAMNKQTKSYTKMKKPSGRKMARASKVTKWQKK